MPTKPKSLIPDANVVIELHRLELWSRLRKSTVVVVPATIAREARYYKPGDSLEEPKVLIDLWEQARQGQIQLAEASPEQLAEVKRQFDSVMAGVLHPGELEALAYLHFNRGSDCMFCCGDKLAVTALVLLGMQDKGLSLEKALQLLSISSKGLRHHFKDDCFRQWTRQASIQRIQGSGLADDPFTKQ